MGNQVVWQDRFNIGVDIIDREHKKLFSILNNLFDLSEQEEKSEWGCREGIKYFKGHAMKHFAEEEAYMASIDYTGFDTHRRLHDYFRKITLPSLERELEDSRYSTDAIKHFLGVCTGWLIGHTLTEDYAITGKTMSRWTNLLPEDEETAIGKVIVQLLFDLFRLNAKVISNNYGGEKFGRGIYYRLLYKTKQKESVEVFLIFEEKLLLSTVGKMMASSEDKLNVLLMNISRYMAKQFVQRIREHFLLGDNYELQDESLLTYDQFQKIFDMKQPRCSLLFDTGEGYFAYCVMQSLESLNRIRGSFKEDNAMQEIGRYLKDSKNPREQKKKILVVDDSSVMCQMMQKLLEKDYDITLANSGLSVIRCIILARPDLVLLDYEMPVCDGRQVLEMIRSEEDMADIPVIFLTGRIDKESVGKVVSLKPEGYLVKSLKPEEIKRNIDNYFKNKKEADG